MSDFLGDPGPLTLGDMVFTDFAIPERVSNGGQTQITVHKLPGGARVLDTMGDDAAAVTWSGIFLGAGAQDLRTQLEQIQLDAQPVDLSWGDTSLSVLLADTQFDEGFQQIGYRVSCIVIPDVPEDDQEDTDDYGAGETPDTQSAAKDGGQAKVTKARTAAAAIPTPPIPPPSSSTFIGG